MAPDKDNLLSYLKRFHTGQRRAVTGQELARLFKCTDAEIRATIHEIRAVDHEPVLSDVSFGYRFATSRREAGHYIASQKSRLREQNESLSGVMRGLDRYFGEPSLFDQDIL